MTTLSGKTAFVTGASRGAAKAECARSTKQDRNSRLGWFRNEFARESRSVA
jgi:NAD(P)-dependent dehydrogenase (short-subunit alcohol dehydrogenase family)